MPKLPVCPHCGTIYRYKDISRIMSRKTVVCYNCSKSFEVKRKKFLILFFIIALFCAIFNIMELYMEAPVNFATLVVTNAVIICAGLLFRPLFTEFKKPPDISANKSKKPDMKNYSKKRK